MKPEVRDAFLLAIAKARRRVDDLAEGHVASLHEIAKTEGKVVRYIRLLAPLAFVSPATVKLIAGVRMDKNLTVTELAKHVDDKWPSPAVLPA